MTSWIYNRLEHISGTIGGASMIVFDIPNTILKVVMAFILGAAGYLGSWCIKYIVERKSKKRK